MHPAIVIRMERAGPATALALVGGTPGAPAGDITPPLWLSSLLASLSAGWGPHSRCISRSGIQGKMENEFEDLAENFQTPLLRDCITLPAVAGEVGR